VENQFNDVADGTSALLKAWGGIMEHFVSTKTLFVLKRYDIANACIMPTLVYKQVE